MLHSPSILTVSLKGDATSQLMQDIAKMLIRVTFILTTFKIQAFLKNKTCLQLTFNFTTFTLKT